MVCGVVVSILIFVFFFKQKTAYEMRISDWSSDVCSSDLAMDISTTTNAPLPTARRSMGRTLRAYVALTKPRVLELLQVTTVPVMTIGRASCRERVCQYVSISVVAVSLKQTH